MFKFNNYLLLSLVLFTIAISCNAQEKKAIKIVIDPGHGGLDPGAVGAISYEKDLTLAISLKLGSYIIDNLEDVEVFYTRKTDKFVELYKRAEIANNLKADLFISIHVNASVKSKYFGTSTYVMGIDRLDHNFEVAKIENSVILKEENYKINYDGFDPNSDESYIVFSLFQDRFFESSLELASKVQHQFVRINRFDFGVKQAALVVLWSATMPAILVETGFITNKKEEQYLNTKAGQDYIASAIFRAIVDYLNSKSSDNENIVPNKPLENILPVDAEENEEIEKTNVDKSKNK